MVTALEPVVAAISSGLGFDRWPFTGHLHSNLTRLPSLDSTPELKILPHKTRKIRDVPTCSAAADVFQRSQVQILSPLRISGSEITDLRA